jgi:hypothetical protein
MMASVLRGMSAMQRGVRGHDRTVRADICTREGRTCPPRRGVYALHLVFLFQLSPKWGMNLFMTLTVVLDGQCRF